MNMWHLKHCNKKVSAFITTESQRRHLSNISNIKPSINFTNGETSPWKPSFSLSRNQNRYYKYNQSQIQRGNGNLVKKIGQIQKSKNHKLKYTNLIPETVPSSPNNFRNFKKRERCYKGKQLCRQNIKIFYRIMSAKNYDHKKMEKQWQQNQKYRDNISMVKEGSSTVVALDYSRLAKKREIERNRHFQGLESRKNSAQDNKFQRRNLQTDQYKNKQSQIQNMNSKKKSYTFTEEQEELHRQNKEQGQKDSEKSLQLSIKHDWVQNCLKKKQENFQIADFSVKKPIQGTYFEINRGNNGQRNKSRAKNRQISQFKSKKQAFGGTKEKKQRKLSGKQANFDKFNQYFDQNLYLQAPQNQYMGKSHLGEGKQDNLKKISKKVCKKVCFFGQLSQL